MTHITKWNSTKARLTVSTLCAVVGILILPAVASADVDFGSTGSGAGQWQNPAGVAVDNATGEGVGADSGNKRIDVFSKPGGFLRAFGWGVADGSPEPQTCTTTCLAGIAGAGRGQL